MFKQARRAGVIAGLALVLLASFVHAQGTGSIAGTITDQSGAIVPGTALELLHRETGQRWIATADARGTYRFGGLAVGTYRLRTRLDGFKDRVVDRIVVAAGADVRVDCTLDLAGYQDPPNQVNGDAPRIDTSATSYGLVIPERDLVELPLNGRNFTQLGTLMPGVTAPPAALGGQAGDATPGGFGNVTGGFNVNGMRNQSNNFVLDGMPNNDTFNTGFVLRPPPDAIQEFRIFTHAYSAERGRNAGSVVSVNTRAGGGLWRASAWEFNRDDALEARNRFAVAKPALRQDQFGGSGGGPLWRNRIFAFGYYEGYCNTRGTTDTRTVLSAAQRAGDFSGAAPITDPLTGRPFEGNRIPAVRLDPTAAALLSAYVPLPNQPGNRFTQSPNVIDRRHQGGGRLDFMATPEHRLMGRVLLARTEQQNPLGPANFSPAGNLATAHLADALVADTWVIGPRAINELRVSLNTIDAHPTTTSGMDPRDSGFAITPSNPAALGLPNIGVNGFFTLGDAQQPFATRTNRVVTIADDATWVVDTHIVKAGVELRHDRIGLTFINRPNGNFTFNGQYTGNAAADFLLGLPQQYRQASGNPQMDGHTWTTSAFVQDEWKPRADVSVSAGVRYERAAPFVERNDKLNAFHPGQQSTRFPQAPLGLVYPGDAGVPRGTYAIDGDNVAPRLAVAWDLGGRGTTVVRAAWGLFYDTLAGQGDFFQNGTLAPPFQPLTEVNYGPTSPTPRFQVPLDGVGGAADFPPGLIFIGWGPESSTPVVQHYHLSLQHDLARAVGLELAYAGSRARNLPIFMEVNPTTPILTGSPRPGPRVSPAFSLVRPTFSEARSSYDALQASARVRDWHGLTALASYTWGHAIDHVSGLNIGGEPRPMLPVTIGDDASFERALEREKGDALFDVRHRFVVSAAYQLPDLDARGALLRHVFGRWQVNAIVQAQTGFALTVTEPVDVALQSLTNRPDVTCDPNAGAPRTIDQWFDTRCFTQLTRAANAGQIGDAGRGIVRGPGFARTDLSLIKRIGLPREQTIELRVEAFNLFDQARYGNPGLSIGTPTFGRITSADDGRIVQLGVKWGWR